MKEPTVPQKPCGLVIENRKKAVLTGVKEVDRFDETAVVLETWGGRLTLTGSGLHVSALQLEEWGEKPPKMVSWQLSHMISAPSFP